MISAIAIISIVILHSYSDIGLNVREIMLVIDSY